MDETAIWNYAPLRKTYVPSFMTGYVCTPEQDHRDSLVVALVGNGRKLPPYMIQSKAAKYKKKEIVEKAVKGMNAEIMVKWLSEIFLPNRGEIKYLLLDRASSHISHKVKLFAKEQNIELIFLPAKTAPDLSPLDNGFFAQLKALLKGHPLGTFQQKQSTIELVMEDIAPETIQKYFVHCGLCHVEDYVVEDSDCFLLSESLEGMKLE